MNSIAKITLMRRFLASVLPIGMMVLAMGVVYGQNYPLKPIRIVTSGAGGSNDFTARIIAQGISSPLGQPVIVENRGANIIIQVEMVTKGPPDGHTLLLHSNFVWLLPLMKNVPYDAVRDFLPITLAVSSPNILVVHPSLPVKSVKDLIALAKTRPGDLNYASGGTGSSTHVQPEMLKAMAGVDMVHVPYNGGAPALNALIGGQVQLMFATAASVAPHLKSGRLRALAVTSAQPFALLPHLPTIAASGVPGYESVAIVGIFAPAKTPLAIITRLNQEIVRVLTAADVKEKFLNAGVEVVGSSPEQFAAAIKSEITKSGKVIKDAGIKAE